MSHDSAPAYPKCLVAALREVVPHLRFYAWTDPNSTGDQERFIIVAVAPDGSLCGGYEVDCLQGERDLFQDTLCVARFFLAAGAAAEVRFHPPELGERRALLGQPGDGRNLPR